MRSPKDSFARQEVCKQRASLQSASSKETNDVEAKDETIAGGIGLLGLGDSDYALASPLFNQFAYEKGFMQDNATEFRGKHSQVLACGTIEPLAKVFRQCGMCCVESAKKEHGFSQESFDQAKNLLLFINGMMKELYRSIKKQITPQSRHPLLFVRMLLPNGAFEWRGWLLTRAVFKPRTVVGVAVYARDPESTLDPPFATYMDAQQVYLSDWRMPEFSCIDGIAREISVLKELFSHDDGCLQYCFNPSYSLSCVHPLTHLNVTEKLNWIQPGSIAYEPSDDEGDDDDDEMDDINDLISSLTSLGAPGSHSGESKKKAASTTKAKKTSTGAMVLNVCDFTALI